jgi:N-acetyl-gamma-glutamyl-phosphate reductase
MSIRVGVVGGRGVVGRELLRLLDGHPDVVLAFASSTESGTPLSDLLPGTRFSGSTTAMSPAQLSDHELDVLLLAAPNGQAASFAQAVAPQTATIDLSSDHRFVDDWHYGLVELAKPRQPRLMRVANPGCYATGAQLGLHPWLPVMGGVPSVFGVSGYSGAGSKPSPKNDPARLADNLMPYGLVDHTHEQEIHRHLGQRVMFMPHVAPFFVGITLTISVPLRAPATPDELHDRMVDAYRGEALVHVQRDIPEVSAARGRHGVTIGGIEVHPSGSHAVVVVTLDNLLKGAATQAVQNMNLMMGRPELMGIAVEQR